MKVDLVIKYKGRTIDVDFDECEDPHDCLDAIIETLGSEIDPEFNGYYQVNQVGSSLIQILEPLISRSLLLSSDTFFSLNKHYIQLLD